MSRSRFGGPPRRRVARRRGRPAAPRRRDGAPRCGRRLGRAARQDRGARRRAHRRDPAVPRGSRRHRPHGRARASRRSKPKVTRSRSRQGRVRLLLGSRIRRRRLERAVVRSSCSPGWRRTSASPRPPCTPCGPVSRCRSRRKHAVPATPRRTRWRFSGCVLPAPWSPRSSQSCTSLSARRVPTSSGVCCESSRSERRHP